MSDQHDLPPEDLTKEEMVELLKTDVEKWNTWRRAYPAANLSGARLSRANLRGANLNGMDLSGAWLRSADLSEANLVRARLRETNLFRADLSWADLTHADLTHADLRHADLYCARLHGVDLNEVDFRWATLVGADLTAADLTGARVSQVSLKLTHLATDLLEAKGLEDVRHLGPSLLDPRIVAKMATPPPQLFLRGVGWPERLVQYWSSLTGVGVEYYSGFISYSQAKPDSAFAQRLHDQLQAKGIRVWKDSHELNPGDDMMEGIDHGIRVWDKVLLCCSERSLNSWWVKREIEKAVDKERRLEKERGKEVRVLIPLNLDGYLFNEWEHKYQSLLIERLAANFTGWETDNAKFEEQFERLVRAMTLGGGRMPPPVPKI